MVLNKSIIDKVIEQLSIMDNEWINIKKYLEELYPPEKYFTDEYKNYRNVWNYFSAIGLNIYLLEKLLKEIKEDE